MYEHQPTHEREQPEPGLRPRIWVASLADYNNGKLHGDWLDATAGADELARGVERILASSTEPGAEEHAIFDYDEFGSFRVGEYEDLATIARVAAGIAEHGAAFAAWAELHDADPDMLAQFEDAYLGYYDTAEEWARESLADLEAMLDRAGIPDALRPHVRVDYDGWARDAEAGGEVHIEPAPGGGIYVFAIH